MTSSSKTPAKILVWLFWIINLTAVCSFWAVNSGADWLNGGLPWGIAFGRLAGLLATFCALTQFILMGRATWLEPLYGLDRLTYFHRLNGYAALMLMFVHVTLLGIGYGELTGKNLISQWLNFEFDFPLVYLASISLFLFTLVVFLSIYIVRKHLKFEAWYFVHLLVYAAIVLVPFHQFLNGGDLFADRFFVYYWIGIYAFTALNLVIWRFGWPVFRYLKHDFKVQKVVAEVPRATSVYISAKNMANYPARGGQFVLVRFLAKGLWWQEHPFSLSRLPSDDGVRLTVRQLGDFTSVVPDLKPNTPVVVSGPYGAFTLDKASKDKVLYIAGGIGITPIRSMIEEQVKSRSPKDGVLIYANAAWSDIALRAELDDLAGQISMPVHHVLSNDPTYQGEKGFIDAEKIARLVPDAKDHDVFLCGPPPMMKAVRAALQSLGVPKKQIHYERFALHPGD